MAYANLVAHKNAIHTTLTLASRIGFFPIHIQVRVSNNIELNQKYVLFHWGEAMLNHGYKGL